LSSACLRILFFVPGASSSPGLPAIVTNPRFVGVFVLAMAAAGAIKIPTVCFDKLDRFAHFHGAILVASLRFVNA
jgi:hypothetical protein